MSEQERFLPHGYEFEGYRIESVRGTCDAGVTYAARELLVGRDVIIEEFLPKGRAARGPHGVVWPGATSELRAAAIDALKRHVARAAAIQHPGLVPVLRSFEHRGTIYCVHLLVAGETLAALIAPDVRLDPGEIEEIAGPIVDALDALHRGGLVHGNIRPESILIAIDGTPLLDGHAGLARFVADDGASDSYTPKRDSPQPGAADDVYALGAVLYRCITGAPPPTPLERSHGAALAPIGAPGLPRALIEMVEQSLAPAPEARPPNAARLRQMLRAEAAPLSPGLARRAPRDRLESGPADVHSEPPTLASPPRMKGPEPSASPPRRGNAGARDGGMDLAMPPPLAFALAVRDGAFPDEPATGARAIASPTGFAGTGSRTKPPRHGPAPASRAPRTRAAGYRAPPKFPWKPLAYAAAAAAGTALLGLSLWAVKKSVHFGIFAMIALARSKPEADEPTESPLDCSVFAPPEIARGESILVQVFVHPPHADDDAAALASAADREAARRGFASLSLSAPVGARISFGLEAPGLDVGDGGTLELVWRDRVASVQFLVSAPAGAALGRKVLSVRAAIDGVPAEVIRFVIEAKVAAVAAAQPLGTTARRYQKAFISYAEEDRAEVMKRVQMLRLAHIDFYQDVLSNEPGDQWIPKIHREIDRCDLFLLFWSSRAKTSEWVQKEIRYALERQKAHPEGWPDIAPVMIEGPPPVEPPPELSHIHFNDRLLYVMSSGGRV